MNRFLHLFLVITLTVPGLWVMPARVMAAPTTVTYNSNDGPSPTGQHIDSTSTGNVLSLAAASGTGGIWTNGNLVFKYWNTADDGTGTNYYPGESLANLLTNPLTLYAIWGPASSNSSSYSLTFDNNGNGESGTSGSTSRESFSVSFTAGADIELDAIPDEGYYFDHWEVSPESAGYFDDAKKAKTYFTASDTEATVTAVFYEEGTGGTSIIAADENVPEILWGAYPGEIDETVKTSGITFKEGWSCGWDTLKATVFSVPEGVKIRMVKFTGVENFTAGSANIKNNSVIYGEGFGVPSAIA